MKRYILSLSAAVVLSGAIVALSGSMVDGGDIPAKATPIVVSIAIPVHHDHRSLNEADHFHVIVRNISQKPVRLWTDRFSWGYGNLSFEQVGEGDKIIRIAKKPRAWTKNFPDWLELQAGESYVLDVNLFNADVWENTPAVDPTLKPKVVTLRAIYETRPDEESTKLGVWTGKITSVTEAYAIW